MHPLAKRLRDDHRHLQRVLAVLEAQMEALGRAEDVDFDLMLDAMTYITEFPNRLHHPVEDVLFDLLAKRDASAAAACREQIAEHERLFHDSAAFYGLLDAVQVDDATLPRDRLLADGRAFIEAQRAHLRREETELLPRAEQRLDTADWDRAALTAGQVDDPLDATTRPARYEALYRALSRLPA
ncbi:hemerythrin domain-containing protein [Immundisolibacter sp.]|uniref:hemerythrin domain-containing protein n=1 Tax=Immundisolibacter sp. TaxID=1934948 RepID=UPI002623AC7E|nr:hemerythrin domain-containing protein [Immundisolibacter sp.]MDD3650612.1 hemerythrin domain-containing protein [Immundisolibacter sp.]